MFPLGTVLFPGELIPLHVFEDRYREMVRDVLAGDGRFGVVLIERGSEVGGGDQRTGVGTVARVVEAAELADGRWVLVVVGERRLRVVEWLPEIPYPNALIEVLDDEANAGDTSPIASGGLDAIERDVRRCLALARELGADVAPFDTELDADDRTRLWQLAALIPAGAIDRQRILAAEDVAARVEALRTVTADAGEGLALQAGDATRGE